MRQGEATPSKKKASQQLTDATITKKGGSSALKSKKSFLVFLAIGITTIILLFYLGGSTDSNSSILPSEDKFSQERVAAAKRRIAERERRNRAASLQHFGKDRKNEKGSTPSALDLGLGLQEGQREEASPTGNGAGEEDVSSFPHHLSFDELDEGWMYGGEIPIPMGPLRIIHRHSRDNSGGIDDSLQKEKDNNVGLVNEEGITYTLNNLLYGADIYSESANLSTTPPLSINETLPSSTASSAATPVTTIYSKLVNHIFGPESDRKRRQEAVAAATQMQIKREEKSLKGSERVKGYPVCRLRVFQEDDEYLLDEEEEAQLRQQQQREDSTAGNFSSSSYLSTQSIPRFFNESNPHISWMHQQNLLDQGRYDQGALYCDIIRRVECAVGEVVEEPKRNELRRRVQERQRELLREVDSAEGGDEEVHKSEVFEEEAEVFLKHHFLSDHDEEEDSLTVGGGNSTTSPPTTTSSSSSNSNSRGDPVSYDEYPIPKSVLSSDGKTRGRALVLYMMHGWAIAPSKVAVEWGNIAHFVSHAYFPGPTEMFDGVDYVFIRSRSSDGSGRFGTGITLCAEHANVKFVWVETPPCDLCAHAQVLEYLGYRSEYSTVEFHEEMEKGRTKGNNSDTAADGNSPTAAVDLWPYRSVVMMNSGVRGPFHGGSYNSPWIDVVSMAGQSERPLFYGSDDVKHFKTVFAPVVSWEKKIHAQSYYIVTPLSALGIFRDVFIMACEEGKTFCIKNAEIETLTSIVSQGFSLYSSLQNYTFDNTKSMKSSRVRWTLDLTNASAVGARNHNPSYKFNDPCRGIFIKFGGKAVRTKQIHPSTLKAGFQVSAFMQRHPWAYPLDVNTAFSLPNPETGEVCSLFSNRNGGGGEKRKK